jgi:succinate dehydrogenase / fumarate reductase iron-sulfur subunit
MGHADFVDATRLAAVPIKATRQEATMHFSIFRYNPERDDKPYMQGFPCRPGANRADAPGCHSADQGFSGTFSDPQEILSRRVCGSDAININGRNGLACITPVRE